MNNLRNIDETSSVLKSANHALQKDIKELEHENSDLRVKYEELLQEVTDTEIKLRLTEIKVVEMEKKIGRLKTLIVEKENTILDGEEKMTRALHVQSQLLAEMSTISTDVNQIKQENKRKELRIRTTQDENDILIRKRGDSVTEITQLDAKVFLLEQERSSILSWNKSLQDFIEQRMVNHLGVVKVVNVVELHGAVKEIKSLEEDLQAKSDTEMNLREVMEKLDLENQSKDVEIDRLRCRNKELMKSNREQRQDMEYLREKSAMVDTERNSMKSLLQSLIEAIAGKIEGSEEIIEKLYKK